MAKQRRGDIRQTKREHLGFDPNAKGRSTTYFRQIDEQQTPVPVQQQQEEASVPFVAPSDLQRALRSLRREIENWRNVFSCEVQNDVTIQWNTYHDFPFPVRVIYGESLVVESGTYQRTYFEATPRTAGVYRFSAHIRLNFLALHNIAEVSAWWAIDGIRVRPFRNEDRKRTGDDPNSILSAILTGTAILPVEAGQQVTVQIYVDNTGAPADESFDFPTSVYGYFDGERLKCEIYDMNLGLPVDRSTYPDFL